MLGSMGNDMDITSLATPTAAVLHVHLREVELRIVDLDGVHTSACSPWGWVTMCLNPRLPSALPSAEFELECATACPNTNHVPTTAHASFHGPLKICSELLKQHTDDLDPQQPRGVPSSEQGVLVRVHSMPIQCSESI